MSGLVAILLMNLLDFSRAVNPISHFSIRPQNRRGILSDLSRNNDNHKYIQLASSSSSSSSYYGNGNPTSTFMPERGERRRMSNRDNDMFEWEDEEEQKYQMQMEIKKHLEAAIERSFGVRPWSIEKDLSRSFVNKYSWTTKLVLANIIGFGLQCLSPTLTQMGVKRSDLILQGKELHRLLTPIFLHGNPIHLVMNTYSLQNIGPEVERMFGPGRFLATYLASGVAGNLLSSYLTPNPALGASGAIFGLVGAYYIFLHRNGRLFGRSGRMQMDGVTRTMILNIGFGFAGSNIDNWGHIGGAIGGAFMAEAFGPKLLVMGLPNGSRIIVDKPTIRLPRSIESIPDKISNKFTRVQRRMRADRYQSDLSTKPWRRNKYRKRRRNPSGRPIKPRTANMTN
jgi:membrane associated rhomboid family serine protease